MTHAIDLLRREHLNMSRLLALLEHQLILFETAGRVDLDLIRSIAEYFGTYPKTCHHPKEDVIYRKLCARKPDVAEEMADLEAEHEHLDARLRDFLRAVDNVALDVEVPREQFLHKARRFVEEERRHMVMEERHFFPLALATLDMGDWADIESSLYSHADPVFDGAAEERFQDLRREIMSWGEEAG